LSFAKVRVPYLYLDGYRPLFWPFIFKKNLEYQDHVKDMLEFKETERIYVKGRNPNCLFASEKFMSTVLL
jgi:hypothetical protein